MKIILMHQTVAKHDAIGNDIEEMFRLLTDQGVECCVYADNRFNENIEYADRDELTSIMEDPENCVIYHHSVYWEMGEKLLHDARCRIIFRYHNITPPSFFKPYNDFHYSQCKLGREQTNRLKKDFPNAVWLCDSEYNAEDLKLDDPSRTYVCAPFHKIDQWSDCILEDGIIEKLVKSDSINLLFVGRVAPNKGHLFLLEILRVFRLNYKMDIRLYIIGKFDDNLAKYNDLIRDKTEKYGLEKNVTFIGEINDSILASYYLGSDFFICASEHEGFCVPVLEAQKFGLPVIALNACAVPDTGGNGQILLEKDPRKFAAAIKLLNSDVTFYRKMQTKGRENYSSRFSQKRLREQFLIQLERIGVIS